MAKKSEFSSILLTAVQQVFQCGALNDVSDFVAVTTAQTGKSRWQSQAPLSSSSTTTTSMTAAADADAAIAGEQDECSITQDHIPDLQPSQSSASSIYVVPSREALEEMVKGSRSTRRQGLFDMDRLFSCGSRDSVVDDDDFDEGDDENHHDHDPASTSSSSVFSRCVAGSAGPTRNVQDSIPRRRRRQQQQQPEDDDRDVEYHFKIHLSPPRTTDMRHKAQYNSSEHDPWDYELRKTMSDSLQQLPEAKSVDSGFSLKSQPCH